MEMHVKSKILIVDDEVDFCLLLKAYLVKKGYEVFVANTLDEGMDTIRRNQPDIVFLDNNLPDGLGWEKAIEIRREFPNIKLNLLSAFETASNNFDSIPIWEKPIDLQRLGQYFK
jgi:DNA-binding response OmpR family regulator